MSNPSKRRGDRAELEVQQLLRDQLGHPARRALGAGRTDDIGDIHGIPDLVVQVVNAKDVAHSVRHKPLQAEQQRLNANVTFACTFVRLKGGEYRVAMTVDQFCTMYREATA